MQEVRDGKRLYDDIKREYIQYLCDFGVPKDNAEKVLYGGG